MSRFDYVKYDSKAQDDQAFFKDIAESLEREISTALGSPRAKSLALTKPEECYMWIGKAIRDDQIERNRKSQLQEERKDG
jgi:hypothetical protein